VIDIFAVGGAAVVVAFIAAPAAWSVLVAIEAARLWARMQRELSGTPDERLVAACVMLLRTAFPALRRGDSR
jgi:hypothetical protein